MNQTAGVTNNVRCSSGKGPKFCVSWWKEKCKNVEEYRRQRHGKYEYALRFVSIKKATEGKFISIKKRRIEFEETEESAQRCIKLQDTEEIVDVTKLYQTQKQCIEIDTETLKKD